MHVSSLASYQWHSGWAVKSCCLENYDVMASYGSVWATRLSDFTSKGETISMADISECRSISNL